MEAGGAWILAGQVNLYRRINHLYEREGKDAPLHSWWAALPPPFDREGTPTATHPRSRIKCPVRMSIPAWWRGRSAENFLRNLFLIPTLCRTQSLSA